MNRIDEIFTSEKLSLGLEFPLDNDWSIKGDAARKRDGRPFGVPDITNHARYATMADTLGFSALWMRDVPVYDPSFGDAAQQFEVFSYLGYLSGITKNILLGTAAVVLPIREPILVAKSAASIDILSNGRLLMGLGLGDRAVEFPLFGLEYENRAERFREAVKLMGYVWKKEGYLNNFFSGLTTNVEVFPKPTNENVPLIMAGYGQQTIEWIASNMQGWFNYPRGVMETGVLVRKWIATLEQLNLPKRPYITAFHLNLLEDTEAPLSVQRFGGSVGRTGLIKLLKDYEKAGVNHMALQLRSSGRPIEDVINEIGHYVLPEFKEVKKD